MFKAILTVIINLLGTLVQVVTFVPNQVLNATLPDVSDKIIQVTENINGLFTGMTWALSFVPPEIVRVLSFIVTVEIAKMYVHISTDTLNKVWVILSKVKLW